MIDPEIWADEELGSVSVTARLLYVGLISLADDEGRLRGDSRFLCGHIFCYDDDIGNDGVEDLLNELDGVGLVECYELNGKEYIAHPNWLRYQQISPSKKRPSDIPEPPSAENSAERQQNGAVLQQSGGKFRPKSKSKSKSKKRSKRSGTDAGAPARGSDVGGDAHPLKLTDAELQPPVPDFPEDELFKHYSEEKDRYRRTRFLDVEVRRTITVLHCDPDITPRLTAGEIRSILSHWMKKGWPRRPQQLWDVNEKMKVPNWEVCLHFGQEELGEAGSEDDIDEYDLRGLVRREAGMSE